MSPSEITRQGSNRHRIAPTRPDNPCLEHQCTESADFHGVLAGVQVDPGVHPEAEIGKNLNPPS